MDVNKNSWHKFVKEFRIWQKQEVKTPTAINYKPSLKNYLYL